MKTLEETIREIKEFYKAKLLYIGLRGSHCIGLKRKESDYDLLIVVDNLKNERIQEDFITLNKETFKEKFYQVHLEVVEALFNEVYIKESYKREVNFLRELLKMKTKEVNFLFYYQIWSMLKNQIKQFYKNEDLTRKKKFLSKSLLFKELLKEENLIEYWFKERKIKENIKDKYFNTRKENYKITQEDLEEMKELNSWRTDLENRENFRKLWERSLKDFREIYKEETFLENLNRDSIIVKNDREFDFYFKGKELAEFTDEKNKMTYLVLNVDESRLSLFNEEYCKIRKGKDSSYNVIFTLIEDKQEKIEKLKDILKKKVR